MLSYLQLFENYNPPEFNRDNPGGDWLKNKQEDAEKTYERRRGITGAVTGYFDRKVKLPTSSLSGLRGARGEESYRTDSAKMSDLEKEIGHPSKFDSEKHPVSIGINHRGEAHVVEGNHRIAYAAKHGIPHVHAEVRYYNGGEVHNNHPLSPSNVEHADRKSFVL